MKDWYLYFAIVLWGFTSQFLYSVFQSRHQTDHSKVLIRLEELISYKKTNKRLISKSWRWFIIIYW